MNRAGIIGNFGAKPELRHTQSGKTVCNFSLAVNAKWGKGEDQQRTDWIDCVAWERAAEVICEYMDKGSKICVEGPLQASSYDDKEGNKRKKTEIVVREFEFLGGGKKGEASPDNGQPEGEGLPF